MREPVLIRNLLSSIGALPHDISSDPLAGLALGLSARDVALEADVLEPLGHYYDDPRPSERGAALTAGSLLRDVTAVDRFRQILNDGLALVATRTEALRTLPSSLLVLRDACVAVGIFEQAFFRNAFVSHPNQYPQLVPKN